MSDFSALSVAGDGDRWMLLERESDNRRPMVIRTRVNAEIHDFAQVNKITAVVCDVEPSLVSDQGMPLCMDALYELEDRLVSLVNASGKQAYHTASATGDSKRTIYFAHSLELDVADVVAAAPSDVATIWCTSEFDFRTYDEFVSPTPLDVQLNGDDAVIASLRTHGDDGSKPRKIDFWFYGERAALEDLVSRLSGVGMSIDHWLDAERPGVVMSQHAPATHQHFAELTPVLLDASQSAGVEYDGWETLVLGEPAQIPAPQSKPSFFGRLIGQRKA